MSTMRVESANVPPGFCALTNAQWQTLVSLLTVTSAASDSKLYIGPSQPGPADWDKLWLRVAADGSPDRLYKRANGMWLSPHPLPPGFISAVVMPEAEVPTWDGGEGTLTTEVTAYSGPMWLPLKHSKCYPNSEGRFLLNAGKVPEMETTRAPGDTGGSAMHTLTIDQMPSHRHSYQFYREVSASGQGNYVESAIEASNVPTFMLTTEATGGGQPFGKMPPWFCVTFVMRTERLYYRV